MSLTSVVLSSGCSIDLAELRLSSTYGGMLVHRAFHSTALGPEHDPVLYRSALTVIWFQPAPDVPSGASADPALREVRWEELAQDHEL
ncbi:hypothetical protein ACIBL3_06655 [Kribbella sp. NPDC050124]|uniref:hypothetical protein n=1 Tax=Kribbella sp. NPDC050124 TaxID=3364114 RepID=UPI00379EEE3B